jgi:hypothetical protein
LRGNVYEKIMEKKQPCEVDFTKTTPQKVDEILEPEMFKKYREAASGFVLALREMFDFNKLGKFVLADKALTFSRMNQIRDASLEKIHAMDSSELDIFLDETVRVLEFVFQTLHLGLKKGNTGNYLEGLYGQSVGIEDLRSFLKIKRSSLEESMHEVSEFFKKCVSIYDGIRVREKLIKCANDATTRLKIMKEYFGNAHSDEQLLAAAEAHFAVPQFTKNEFFQRKMDLFSQGAEHLNV